MSYEIDRDRPRDHPPQRVARARAPLARGLDQSIQKANTCLAEIADEFGAGDRRLAYRVTRAWPHTLRDRLPVTMAANFAAQLS